MTDSTVKTLRCVETALENQEKNPIKPLAREDCKAAIENAVKACEQHKREAHRRVTHMLHGKWSFKL